MTTRLTTRGTTRLTTRGTSPGVRFDADTQAIIAALVAAGATVTSPQQTLINNFITTGKTAGWYSSLRRLYLPVWGSATPNAIDWMTRGSGSFVGGVTHSSGFIQGNGTTGYFNTNSIPSVIGMTLTSASFGALLYGGGAAVNQIAIGARSGTNDRHHLQWNGLSTFAAIYKAPGGDPINITSTLAATYGINSFQYTSPSRYLAKRSASGRSILGTGGDGVGAVPTVATFIGGTNNSGVLDLPSTYQIGAAFLGVGMSNTQDAAFTLALKNLWEGLTGLVLP
jgi:hypothetical protein